MKTVKTTFGKLHTSVQKHTNLQQCKAIAVESARCVEIYFGKGKSKKMEPCGGDTVSHKVDSANQHVVAAHGTISIRSVCKLETAQA